MSTNVTFLTASSNDPRKNVEWKEGEKVLVVKYDEHNYWATYWQITTIKKVNKASIVIDTTSDLISKFDKNGVLKIHSKSKAFGNYDSYWVLYNADLVNKSEDIEELVNKGYCGWGFRFPNNDCRNKFINKVTEFK